MDNKLLLVNSITLLYRESQLSGTRDNSATLVRKIIEGIRLPDISIGFDRQKDIMEGLIRTAIAMCNNPPDHTYELMEILQTLKVNTLEEEGLYEAFYDGMSMELTESQLKKTCLNLKRTLNNYFREKAASDIISKAASKLKFEKNQITDFSKFVAQVMSELEPFQVDNIQKDPAIVGEIDLSDTRAVEEVYCTVQSADSGASIMQTGWQGLNRALDGGFRRGEQAVIGALQHKFKTGFSLTIFKQIALYNTPQMIDPNKKPLLVRMSMEDGLDLNFQFLYQSLKENETGVKADLSGVTNAEMARYVQSKLQVNGYEVKLLQIDPSQWNYKDITNKLLEYEADGYEIHMLMVDYLDKIQKTGLDQGPAGHDIRNMYERLRNFCNPRGICFITPHQLSTEAKMLIRDGRPDFVRELPGKGFYAGCRQIDQVVDLEIFIHIEKVNGKSYLTIQRGKHRKIVQTPEEFLYFILPFEEVGAIRDDLYKADTTRKKVGGGPIGANDENPFWEFQEKKAA